MWNEPRQEKLNQVPMLYSTEYIALPDKTIHIHFFLGGCDWYVCEHDGSDLFWGFACLNGDLINAEFGYISYSDLKAINVNGVYQVEYDEYWRVRPAREVELICRGQGWNYNKIKNDYV